MLLIKQVFQYEYKFIKLMQVISVPNTEGKSGYESKR